MSSNLVAVASTCKLIGTPLFLHYTGSKAADDGDPLDFNLDLSFDMLFSPVDSGAGCSDRKTQESNTSGIHTRHLVHVMASQLSLET